MGNRWRGDDAVGPLVGDRLAGRAGVDVAESDGEPLGLVTRWSARPVVVVVDAVATGAAPGRVHRWEPTAGDPLPPGRATSSHAAGPAEAWALGRALDRLPGRLVVLGVEVGSTGAGEPLSPPVAAAVEAVVRAVEREVEPDGLARPG